VTSTGRQAHSFTGPRGVFKGVTGVAIARFGVIARLATHWACEEPAVKFGTSFKVMKDPGNEECQGGVVTLEILVVLVALSYHWLVLTCHWLLDGFDTCSSGSAAKVDRKRRLGCSEL
jgi:hypothetical protein